MNRPLTILILLAMLLPVLLVPNAAAADAYVVSDGWEWHYDTTTPHSLTKIVQVGGASTNVTMPETLDGIHPVTMIAGNCFQDVEGAKLTVFWHMPDTVTSIGAGAFYNCVNLVYVDISSSLVSIGQNSFVNTKITSITFPDTFTTWALSAFGGCTQLAAVDLGDSLTSIPANGFLNLPITTMTVPDTVTSIGNSAFQGNTALTFVKLGTGLTTIGNNFLYGATVLETVEFWMLDDPTVGTDPFSGANADARGHAKPESNFPYPGDWHGLVMSYQISPPPVPANLLAGMNGNMIHVQCDVIGGLIDAVAYYRSIDNINWKFRSSNYFEWNDSIGEILYSGFYYKARSANMYGFSAFTTPVYVATLSTFEQLPVYEGYDFPIWDAVSGEPSLVMVGNTLHGWFASGPSLGESNPHYLTLWHTQASNATLSDWSTPVKCTGAGMDNSSRFPFVLYESSKFYLFNSPYYDADVYLWESTDGNNWSVLNGGNPIIKKSVYNSSIYYHIWNVGVCVVNGIWHMWLECGTRADQSDTMSAYTWGTLSNLDWQQHMRQTRNGISSSNNLCPVYVPTKNAFIILSAKPDPVYYEGQPYPLTHIGIYTVSASSDLYNPSSYHQSQYFRIGNGEDVSDPHIAFTDGVGDFEFVIQYYSNDAARPHVYQIAGYLDENQFYDWLVNGPVLQETDKKVVSYLDVMGSGIIWLIIYFVVIIILSLILGKWGALIGLFIMGLASPLILDGDMIVSVFSIVGGVIIIFAGGGDDE